MRQSDQGSLSTVYNKPKDYDPNNLNLRPNVSQNNDEFKELDKTQGDNSVAATILKLGVKAVEKVVEVAKRPSWRESEKDVASKFGEDAKTQVSYKDGQEVVSGSKGSVKPDVVVNDTAIEVKNYSIDNASNMVNTIAKQVNQRADHLPDGMTQQVVIDFKGQNVTDAQIYKIEQAIISKTNGILKPDQIEFKLH